MGLAERVLETRSTATPEQRAMQVMPWGPWDGSGGPAVAGVNVNQASATNLLAVYGSTQLISDTIAMLPRDVYREPPGGQRTEVSVVPRWVDDPNPETTATDFITQTLMSLLLDGNAYWVWSIDGNGLPNELRVLDPIKVGVRRDSDGGPLIYTVNQQVYRGRLLHIRGIMRPGAIKGMSPVENARQSIGLGLAAQTFGASFYANGINMSGIVEVPTKLTLDAAKELAQKMSLQHGGLENAHKPGVLDNGAHWTQISVTPEQAQFLATREFTAAEIAAQMFLLDPSMLGIAINRGQNLTYGNLADRGTHLVQFTLMRWIVRLETAYEKLLPANWCLKFNVDELKRADLKARYESYQIALGGANGSGVAWMTPSEVRDLEDMGENPADLAELNAPPAAPAVGPPLIPPAAGAAPSSNGNGTQPQPTRVHVEPHIHIPRQAAPQVRIEPTQVTVEPAQVNVTLPEMQAPQVTVERTDVRVEPAQVNVTLPEQQPANVTVEPAQVNIEATQVTVEPAQIRVEPAQIHMTNEVVVPPTTKNVKRDRDGRILAIEEVR